jgi:hypothetical protein
MKEAARYYAGAAFWAETGLLIRQVLAMHTQ